MILTSTAFILIHPCDRQTDWWTDRQTGDIIYAAACEKCANITTEVFMVLDQCHLHHQTQYEAKTALLQISN